MCEVAERENVHPSDYAIKSDAFFISAKSCKEILIYNIGPLLNIKSSHSSRNIKIKITVILVIQIFTLSQILLLCIYLHLYVCLPCHCQLAVKFALRR